MIDEGFFQGHLKTISKIQTSFYREFEDFLYFRKGEFANISIILSFVDEYISKTGKKRKFLIIASEESNTDELNKFEEKGGRVCVIPKTESGKLRFLVNEKRYCIFIRADKNKHDFFGIIGREQKMINRLKKLFKKEFKEYYKKREKY